MNKERLGKALIPIIVWIVLLFIPVPRDLQPNAWHYFGLFAAVIVGLILEPLPGAALGVIGVTVAVFLQLISTKPAEGIRWALSGFSNSTVWLIFVAYMFALGYEKSGLGRRMALFLVKALGKKTLGLGYAIALSDLVLAPFIPSNTARSGGTIYPIIKNIPGLYGSFPDETARKIGSYIMWTALATTCVTSSMFLTALAPNLLALDLVNKTVNVTFTWREWFLGFLPVGGLLIMVLPFLVFKIYPPEIRSSKNVQGWARDELSKLGAVSRQELIMACLAVVALVLWIFGGKWLDATTVALICLSLMIVTGIFRWNDLLNHKQAWNVLVWFATLVTLADGLRLVGFFSWFATHAAALMKGMPVNWAVVLLVAIFFLVHYMFASLAAHTTALLPVFLVAGAAVPGMPIKLLSLLFCYSIGMMGILTPYATGPGPIYYGSGYVKRRDFWVLGLIFGVIFLAVFLLIGLPYLGSFIS